ncbi:MAG: ATPase, partial [Paenibacillus sp.]|nr:ATPase [Paenibacillus sp.]
MSHETERKELSFKKKLAFTVQEQHHDHDETGCSGHSCSHGPGLLNEEQEPAAIEPSERLRSYRIEGMDCSSCAMTIENHLRMIPSVKQVRIQFATGKMQIEHDNSVEEIVKEVGKAGYRASLITSLRSANSTDTKRRDPHKSMTVISGVLLLFGYLGQFASVSVSFQTMLYAVSIVVGGYRPARSAFYAIKSRSLDMNVLMTTAA